jgi:hypothetical protein
MVIGRFRFVVIAIAVVIVAGFAVLGAQIWLLNARIDQLATKVNGIDATFGAKFEETSAKLDGASMRLDAISQRLSAEFKTIGAEIVAQTSAIAKSIASLRGLAPCPEREPWLFRSLVFGSGIRRLDGEAVGGGHLARTSPRRVTRWLGASTIAPPGSSALFNRG